MSDRTELEWPFDLCMKPIPHPHVYISGPMTLGDQTLNQKWLVDCAELFYNLGAVPIVPVGSILWHSHYPKTHRSWLDIDCSILLRCDLVFRIPGRSKGADQEEEAARVGKIPHFTKMHKAIKYLEHLETERWPVTLEDPSAIQKLLLLSPQD